MGKFSIIDRAKSFRHAIRGMRLVFFHEHNAWVHLSLATLAVAMGFYFEITSLEWVAIIICIGTVLSAEIFNTSIEHIANFIQPNQDIKIKDIKDLAAGGVLIVALTSLIVGLVIFVPKIIELFG